MPCALFLRLSQCLRSFPYRPTFGQISQLLQRVLAALQHADDGMHWARAGSNHQAGSKHIKDPRRWNADGVEHTEVPQDGNLQTYKESYPDT